MSKRTSRIGKVFAFLLLLLLIFGIVGAALLTRGFQKDAQTLYLQQGDRRIMYSTKEYEMPSEPEVRFDVKFLLGMGAEEPYTVRILPAVTAENAFAFYVDGRPYRFAANQELTAGFDVKIYGTYFTLNCSKSMEEILSLVYDGKAELAEGVELNPKQDYFRLEVKSGKSELTVDFRIHYRVVTVELTPGEVVF